MAGKHFSGVDGKETAGVDYVISQYIVMYSVKIRFVGNVKLQHNGMI